MSPDYGWGEAHGKTRDTLDKLLRQFNPGQANIIIHVPQRHASTHGNIYGVKMWPLHSNALKPFILQRFTRRNPFPRIKTGHGTYKAFKVIINTIPEREWLTRGLLVKSIPSHFENANPWIITKILQEPIEPVFIREVRDLTLDHDSKGIDALFQLVFLNCENNAPVNGADTLDS